MDAQTTAVFATLAKELLPKLHAKLAALGKLPAAQRACDEDCAQLIAATQEALAALAGWAGLDATAATADATSGLDDAGSTESALIADDDEAAMMAAMDPELAAALAADGGVDPGAGEEGPTAEADTDAAMLDELDPELAAAMLAAEQDSADAAPQLPAAKAKSGGMPKVVPTATVEDDGIEEAGDMGDDEAMALLAAMDAPVTAEDDDTEAAGGAPAGEMNDDEAMALLAAMDSPATPEPAKGAPKKPATATAKAPPNAVKAVPPPPAAAPMSADDEAMALLASLGGDGGDEEAEAPAPAPAAAHGGHSGHDDDEDDGGEDGNLQEIPEFASNDFASDPEMLNDFTSNTDDLMTSLDERILALEQNPRDKETIEEIFRAAHTLKGAAGMFGFKGIERVMHRMESLFDQVRKGVLIPDSNIIDVVLQGLDVLRTLLEAVKNGAPSGVKTVPIVRSLTLAAKGKYVKGSLGGGGAASAPAARSAPDAEAAGSGEAEGGGGGGAAKKKSTEQSTIRVDLERLDALVNLVGELVIDRTRFATIDDDIRTTNPQLKVAGNMSETVQLFGRHMSEIYDIIMKIRMVPIGNTFNKFTRIVRDIGRQLGKDMELYIDGEATELDKTLVEQIGDPLIHLIRNSCDHGIEMPDVRAASGKRRTGQIFLSARQEGNHIIITIQDDGKGLPVEAIRKKAIEKGLITAEMVLAKRDIFNLIFEPGFSTAEKVTNLSGRGVGMDVVRKQISKLKGLIDMDSEPGKGTTTTIRLPLTLAIMQSLLIDSAGECFAIPLSTVVESVRIKPEEIQFVGDAEVIKRHDRVLPLMYLHDHLDLVSKAKTSWYSARPQTEDQQRLAAMRLARRKDRLYVVIVGTGDRRFGIVVDQLLTQQEMVIKSLGPVLRKTPCVAGGAVLGNGEVVLVLDVQELEDRFRSRNRGKAA